jgi:hypothetical protein
MIKEEAKLLNVRKELDYLTPIVQELEIEEFQRRALIEVNHSLWIVEDKLRECESSKRFDSYFIALAIQVYTLNDERASIKKQINIDTGSNFTEEKSYKTINHVL